MQQGFQCQQQQPFGPPQQFFQSNQQFQGGRGGGYRGGFGAGR
jgi:hypothetical protein